MKASRGIERPQQRAGYTVETRNTWQATCYLCNIITSFPPWWFYKSVDVIRLLKNILILSLNCQFISLFNIHYILNIFLCYLIYLSILSNALLDYVLILFKFKCTLLLPPIGVFNFITYTYTLIHTYIVKRLVDPWVFSPTVIRRNYPHLVMSPILNCVPSKYASKYRKLN